jgi:hypothetical protein
MSGVGLEVVIVPEGQVLYTLLLFHHFSAVIVMSGHLHQLVDVHTLCTQRSLHV